MNEKSDSSAQLPTVWHVFMTGFGFLSFCVMYILTVVKFVTTTKSHDMPIKYSIVTQHSEEEFYPNW